MADTDIALDQLLSFGGLGSGPYGGGDTVVWSPDGVSFLIHANIGGTPALWQIPRGGGYPRRVVELGSLPFLASPQQRWSPDARWVTYLSEYQGANEVWLWDAATGLARPLTTLGNNIASYSWKPDSQSILVASNRRGTYDVYRVAVPGGAATRLTSDPRYEVSPVATPDGQNVLYVRLDEHWVDHEIVKMRADGGDAQVVTIDHDLFDYHYGRTFGPPIISPDGQRLLFRSHRSGWINYWSVPLDGGEPTQLCPQPADQSGAAWSPDGRQIAFVSNVNGTLALWLCDADGRHARAVVQPELGLCQAPAWSPDGQTIGYLAASPTEPQDLWSLDVASGRCLRITDSLPLGSLRGQLSRPEKITYESFDGLAINGYLYRPRPCIDGQQYPAILLIHGGPTSQFSDGYDAQAQFLSRRGYAVLMPNIRGSSGYGKQFEDLNNGDWGHGDLRDAIAGADWLRAQPWIDAGNIGITGTSYGGCLSMSATCFTPGAFQAAASHAGYADWVHVMDEQEKRHLQLMRYEFGSFDTHQDVYRRCSPIFHADQVTTPMLVQQGEGQLPRSDASRRFVAALERHYKLVEYRVYPNESYYVRSRSGVRQMYLDLADFFDRHLRFGPAAVEQLGIVGSS